MATDRLTLTRALEEGGIPRDAAENIATQIFDAIHDNVATKADIEGLEAEIQRLEAATKADILHLEATTKTEVQRLEARIDLVEHRLVVRLGSMIAAATGILIAIHYIH